MHCMSAQPKGFQAMKPFYLCLLRTTVAASLTTIYAHAGITATSRECSLTSCASVSQKGVPPASKAIRLADDYCNTRCDQKFNYCLYLGKSVDTCSEALRY